VNHPHEQRREEMQEQHLADIGELAGVISHEFTNFLNVLLLQVSVLEYQLPQHHRTDLAVLRKHGNTAAEVVGRFQDYRRSRASTEQEVHLNDIVTVVVNGFLSESPALLPLRLLDSETTPLSSPADTIPLRLTLSPQLPFLQGCPRQFQRLLRFLLSNAARAAAQQCGQVHVQTEATADRVQLRIEDSGANVSPEDVLHLFEPSHRAREGVESLELAACKLLVRRLGGAIQAESRPEGGLRIVVQWPVTARHSSKE
jgi:signal transduction histidine kinase